MADTRYLKRRRQTWYFHLATPRDVRAKVGKNTITETLNTRDLSKAQKLRWSKLTQWTEAFERLRGNLALTGAEIEEHARSLFQSFLVEMEQASKDSRQDIEAQIEALGIQADLIHEAANARPRKKPDPRVTLAIADIRRRTGAEVLPGSSEA
jgi:glutamyl-tRNA reductase